MHLSKIISKWFMTDLLHNPENMRFVEQIMLNMITLKAKLSNMKLSYLS